MTGNREAAMREFTQGVTMPSRYIDPAFCIESERAATLKHFYPTNLHKIALFTTLREWIQSVKSKFQFFSMVTMT